MFYNQTFACIPSSIVDVREHLGDFLEKYHGLFTDSNQIMELCTLCVHCLEVCINRMNELQEYTIDFCQGHKRHQQLLLF
jgi:hypothetical protein